MLYLNSKYSANCENSATLLSLIGTSFNSGVSPIVEVGVGNSIGDSNVDRMGCVSTVISLTERKMRQINSYI